MDISPYLQSTNLGHASVEDSSRGMCTGENDPSLNINWKHTQKIVHIMAWQEEEVEIKKQINRVGDGGSEWTD